MFESSHHSDHESRHRPAKKNTKGFKSLTRRINHLIARLPVPDLGPWGRAVGIGGLFLGTVLISLVVGGVLRALITSNSLNPFAADTTLPIATPNATPNPEFLAPTVDVGNDATWNSDERVTVLLLGADTRPENRGFTRPRTDSIMLLMIDPTLNVASVLSIPRDLYVEIPGYGLNRINTAYVFGGGDLAMQTVEYNFGVRVNYYVLVEFDAFTTLIDEIGGIDIYVPYTIYDDTYPDMDYGYDPFYIEAGMHHLDGETALKYARTRHTDNDFYRAQRQQDILMAVRSRVLDLNMLPTLVQRAPSLYGTLSNSIQTNMTLDTMTSLAPMALDVDRENIRSGVIDSEYSMNYVTAEGAMVLVPNREKIGELMQQVFWLDENGQAMGQGGASTAP